MTNTTKETIDQYRKIIADAPEGSLERVTLSCKLNRSVDDIETIVALYDENQAKDMRIAELEQERDSLKPCAILAVDTLLNIESCAFDCGDDYPDAKEAAHWMQGEATKWLNDHAEQKSCLKNHNTEQQIKGLEDLEIDPVDDSQEIILRIIERRIEQLQKDCCQHNWVTAKNEHVKNGSVCSKCFAISELEPEQLRKGGE